MHALGCVAAGSEGSWGWAGDGVVGFGVTVGRGCVLGFTAGASFTTAPFFCIRNQRALPREATAAASTPMTGSAERYRDSMHAVFLVASPLVVWPEGRCSTQLLACHHRHHYNLCLPFISQPRIGSESRPAAAPTTAVLRAAARRQPHTAKTTQKVHGA